MSQCEGLKSGQEEASHLLYSSEGNCEGKFVALVAIEHVEVNPGMCGGKPHIVGHRITVQNIVIWYERMGMSPDEIATEYGLTLGGIYAALAYYHDHRAEIDGTITADQALVAELRHTLPSRLAEKIRGRSN